MTSVADFKTDTPWLYSSPDFGAHKNWGAQKVHEFGTLLTRPFLFQANLVTKLVRRNLRPGKAFSELPIQCKVWKVLRVASVFTVVIPLVTGILALLGFLLRSLVGLKRPTIRVLASDKPFKKSQSGEQIEIMTYNLALMPRFIANLNGMRSSNKRAEEIGRTIRERSPDILCLQECFDEKATAKLCEDLKKIYPVIVYRAGFNSGLLIASKFNVESASFTKFTNLKGDDSIAGKGFLGISFKIGSTDCSVYNTHLQAYDGDDYEQIRESQVEQIKKHVQESHSNCTFIAGDFNISRINEKGQKNKTDGLVEDSNFYDFTSSSPNNGTWYKRDETWGTKNWHKKEVEGCIYDRILYYPANNMPKDKGTVTFGCLEKENSVSGQSDHLPISVSVKVN